MEHVDGVALLFIRTPLLKKSDSRSSLPLVNEIHDRWGGRGRRLHHQAPDSAGPHAPLALALCSLDASQVARAPGAERPENAWAVQATGTCHAFEGFWGTSGQDSAQLCATWHPPPSTEHAVSEFGRSVLVLRGAQMHGNDGRAEGKSDVSREGGCPYKPSGSHRSSSELLPGHGAGVLLWQPHQARARSRSSALGSHGHTPGGDLQNAYDFYFKKV